MTSSPSVGWPTSLWLNTLYDQVCLSVMLSCLWEYATVFEIRLHMSHYPPASGGHGTQAPVAGVALRAPLFWHGSLSCQRCTHTSTLVQVCEHRGTRLDHQLPSKQEGSLEITTRIEHSAGAWKFAWQWVCALSCVAPVFWDGCLQSPELTSGWVRKENAFTSISILSYPRAYWYNETIILLSGVSGTLAETFHQMSFWKVLHSQTRPLCILVLYLFFSFRIHKFSAWQWAQFLSECEWWEYF